MKSHTALPEAVVQALLVDSEPWLSCDDCFDQADTAVEAVLSGAYGFDEPFGVHLRACGVCMEEALSLATLIAADFGLTEDQALTRVTAAAAAA